MSKPGRRVLETPRLTLEPTGPHHAGDLFRLSMESAAELEPFMAWLDGLRPQDTEAFAADAARGWDEGSGWNFTIVRAGEVAGSIGLHRYVPMWSSADIGYWIATSLAGRGFVTEAASAVVEFGFEEVNLHRITLQAAPNNTGSVAIAEKLGFRREGLLREASRGVSGFYDCLVFGLLATDPRPGFHLD